MGECAKVMQRIYTGSRAANEGTTMLVVMARPQGAGAGQRAAGSGQPPKDQGRWGRFGDSHISSFVYIYPVAGESE